MQGRQPNTSSTNDFFEKFSAVYKIRLPQMINNRLIKKLSKLKMIHK